MSGKYDGKLPKLLKPSSDDRTRGHSCKIQHQASIRNVRKYSFPLRVCKMWNDLTEKIVTSTSLNSFKNRLDKFWCNQLFKYDPEAEYDAKDNSYKDQDQELFIEEPEGS